MPAHTLLNLSALMPDIPPDSILSRTVFSNDALKAVFFGFAPGQELSEHTASVPAVIHILSGEAELTLGGERVDAAPGTWAHMPAHLPHSVRARTPVTMLLLMLREEKPAA